MLLTMQLKIVINKSSVSLPWHSDAQAFDKFVFDLLLMLFPKASCHIAKRQTMMMCRVCSVEMYTHAHTAMSVASHRTTTIPTCGVHSLGTWPVNPGRLPFTVYTGVLCFVEEKDDL